MYQTSTRLKALCALHALLSTLKNPDNDAQFTSPEVQLCVYLYAIIVLGVHLDKTALCVLKEAMLAGL